MNDSEQNQPTTLNVNLSSLNTTQSPNSPIINTTITTTNPPNTTTTTNSSSSPLVNFVQLQKQQPTKLTKDATNKIQAILDKPFDKLPVSKDIPRLLKKIFLISQFLTDHHNITSESPQNPVEEHHDTLSPPVLLSSNVDMSLVNMQQEDRWKHSTNIEFNRENYPDLVGTEDIPKEIIFYQMIDTIVNHVLLISKKESNIINTMFTIPSYQDYISHIDFNDHRTLNEFLLNAIAFNVTKPIASTKEETTEGEQPVASGSEENRNHLILLLKCCQQTIIINVLMGLREFTMKHKIHFKDARGAWRIYIGSEDYTLKESTNSEQPVFSSSFYVAHERSEQLYMKRLDWMQQYGISDEELAQLEANDPREQVNFSKGAMKQLFQFKWQIKLCFSNESVSKLSNNGNLSADDWEDYKLTHVDITLLGIDYTNEDLTVSHQRYCAKEVSLLEQYFGMFKSSTNALVSPSLSSPNQANDVMSPTTLEFSKITLGSPFGTPRSVGTPTVMGSSSFMSIIGSSTNGKSSPLTKHVTTSEELAAKNDSVVVESSEPTLKVEQTSKNDGEAKPVVEQVVESNVIVEKEQEKEVSGNSLLINNHSTLDSRSTTLSKNSQQVPPQLRNDNSNIQYQTDTTSSHLLHSDKINTSKKSDDTLIFCIPRTLLIALPLIGWYFVDHHDKQHETHHDDGDFSEERKLLD